MEFVRVDSSRKNYHIPDFTFYYTIPELDFEMIAMDYNIYDFEGIGGNGYGETGGAREAKCEKWDPFESSLEGLWYPLEAKETCLNGLMFKKHGLTRVVLKGLMVLTCLEIYL